MAKQKTLIDDMEERGQQTYRELSVPFPSVDEANENVQAFHKELYELRKKYRFRELLYVIESAVIYDSGTESDVRLLGYFGDLNQQEALAAWAFGQASAERQERIAGIAAEAVRAIKNPSTRK